MLLYSRNAPFGFRRYADFGWGETAMFDIYLNGRRDLLVVPRGFPIPPGDASGRWRKRKRKVVSVSEEIRRTVLIQGYYMRKLNDLRKN